MYNPVSAVFVHYTTKLFVSYQVKTGTCQTRKNWTDTHVKNISGIRNRWQACKAPNAKMCIRAKPLLIKTSYTSNIYQEISQDRRDKSSNLTVKQATQDGNFYPKTYMKQEEKKRQEWAVK